MPGAAPNTIEISKSDAKAIYRACLTTLLANRERLSIVIVGANDGRIADPSYNFISDHRDRTDILLVEPQKALLPFLSENFKDHPSAKIFNGVVADQKNMEFFAIRESAWESVQPSYAKKSDGTQKWPLYRAPTGISSTIREHVEKWLTNFPEVDADQAIESYSVRGAPLVEILDENALPRKIDALQIDAEGADLQVLKLCGINETRPALIFIETSSIKGDDLEEMTTHLHDNGYQLFYGVRNSLAISIQ